MGEICQRYSLSRNHVYQILFKFCDMFAELGENIWMSSTNGMGMNIFRSPNLALNLGHSVRCSTD